MRSCSTNQRRTSFSLFVFALPEPREAAPVSSTTAARPCGLRLARIICTQPQSPGVARTFGKAVKLVGVVVGFLPPILIPHGIGDDAVERLEAIALVEFRVFERIAQLDVALH